MGTLHLIQLVAVAVLLSLVFLVLLSICQGVSKLQSQLRGVLRCIQASPPASRQATLERKQRMTAVSSSNGNGLCVSFREERERELGRDGRERALLFPAASDSTDI